MGHIVGSHHTSYTVRDMARSLAFYCDLLGLRLIHERPEVTAQYFRDIIAIPDALVHAVLLEIPGSGHYLELFEYKHPRADALTLTPSNQPGSSHICYLVDDLPALYEKLKAADCAFISDPIYIDQGPNAGGWALYMKDPDGIPIELFQMAK
jgi:catechol 2,3-dioxygenase-like lactoylglutathione lyase family enzyme